MTAEKFMVEGGSLEEYPSGLRVLAVDDDPICLKLLDALLKKCQYNVTTTSQARVALKMLRENKDGFDLVISDVHMPDMDGFKLLELVGLEMDLPVIMLSANSDPKLVLKGVTHGACDYLVKPVRIEELRNIWQHVIRRKKLDKKLLSKVSEQGKSIQQNEGHCFPLILHENQDGSLNRKRKEEEDDSEDNDNTDEDPTSQKKPRVVWSMELHRKFVTAVNQLGYDKAVPKKILELMNVEGLTRENVASHLQKYRLYLKRISSDAKQAAALNSQFIGPYTSLGDLYFPATPARLGTSVLSQYQCSGMLGKLESSSNAGTLVNPNRARSITGLGKILPGLPSMMQQSSSLFSGSVVSLDQLQMNKCGSDMANIGDPSIYEASNMITGQEEATGSCSNSGLRLKVPPAIQTMNGGVYRSVSPLNLASFTSEHGVGSSKSQPNCLIRDASFRSHGISAGPYSQKEATGFAKAVEDSREAHFSECVADHLLDSSQPRWADYNALNSYEIGTANQHASSFMNERSAGGSSTANLMQQNKSRGFAADSLGQSKLHTELFACGYDPFDDIMNGMIKQEDNEALRNCMFGFEDYSSGVGL